MCGMPMFLSRIEPADKADHDRRTFECPTCRYSQTVTVKYKDGEPTMITLFAPTTAHSDSIVRPSCSECGTATLLVGIEPERPGYELHTFECPTCRNFETAVGKAT